MLQQIVKDTGREGNRPLFIMQIKCLFQCQFRLQEGKFQFFDAADRRRDPGIEKIVPAQRGEKVAHLGSGNLFSA